VPQPGPGEVLVKVEVSVTDLHAASGDWFVRADSVRRCYDLHRG
jgi:hypothetical protein